MRFLEHRDHPREYGENNGTGESAGVGLGPSPRIRGELTELLGNTSLTGTIPANTGRMVPATEETQVWRDHPREYGENPLGGKFSLDRVRTIPANTGRITKYASCIGQGWDHPREYGENLFQEPALHRF